MNATPADGRIISNATIPSEPYFPKVLPITLVAAFAGFLLSTVFVMLSELFSGRAIRYTEPETDDDVSAAERPVRTVAAPLDTRRLVQAEEGRLAARYADENLAGNTSLLALEPDDTEVAADMQSAADEFIGEEFSVSAVARHLVDNDVNVAVAVSLSGDAGSTSTVILARTVAELGRKTILIDMTGSALPTRLMAEHVRQPGITDLLCGEVSIADTIHGDRLSEAHILPHGNANAKRAMRAAERLGMIVDSLANAYDLVIVECGPANVEGVKRLARSGQTEIILSAHDASNEDIEKVATSFIDAGYEDVVLLFGGDKPVPPSSRRTTAA
jgi:Mrp family chromosome partitioning ATPase